jgi:flagellar L-ring protein precursor FlgH
MKRHSKFAISLMCLVIGAPMLRAQDKDKDQPQPARRLSSWTSDKREYQVGDVITVLVSEATLATATKSQSGSDQQTRKNGVGIHPPTIGTTALPSLDADMSMDKNASSKQSGDAQRNVNFKGNITVRVVAVDKTGLLQIKGNKIVDVDKNKQTLNLAGWVRPEDVSPSNLVISERVADVQLTYACPATSGRSRWSLGRLLNVFAMTLRSLDSDTRADRGARATRPLHAQEMIRLRDLTIEDGALSAYGRPRGRLDGSGDGPAAASWRHDGELDRQLAASLWRDDSRRGDENP